ncbi:hypothetical protein M5X17_27575 [Paenibacillus alvei]|uniref:phage holin, LLH family n=1 Tax=Paenibacillus alvei TaxID=44250 RepID=UPI00227F5719|nr:phage holin, LLH family [Paenibacillus alvei]MCY9737466.1 hypothetical protein [Paenibacillus alvei]
MDTLSMLTLGVVLLIIFLVGFVLVPFLKKKGYLQSESIEVTKQMLTLAGVVLDNLNTNNTDTHKKAEAIVKVCERAVLYVEQTEKYSMNEDKKKLAVDTAIDMLEQMGVTVDEKVERLIEVGIESAVMLLPRTK